MTFKSGINDTIRNCLARRNLIAQHSYTLVFLFQQLTTSYSTCTRGLLPEGTQISTLASQKKMSDSPSPTSVNSELPRAFIELLEYERAWRDRYSFLLRKGYELRPRLKPDWKPSWEHNGKNILDCEDAIILPARPNLVDALKTSDKRLIYIKRVRTGDLESRIATMLTTTDMLANPRNHCVPILDTFQDDLDETISYIVMPFLRLMDEPPLETVAEVMDFVTQLLEGLIFLHDHGVAHRDCSRKNLMMDASAMYPQRFHPVKQHFLPDAITPAWPLSRTKAGSVKYYYVDFGISVQFAAGESDVLTDGFYGRDREPPELQSESQARYNPFKLDIFIVGNVFRRELYDKYSNIEFLAPLISRMVADEPSSRPNAKEAFEQWCAIKKSLSPWSSRLRQRDETFADKVILNAIHFVRWTLRMT